MVTTANVVYLFVQAVLQDYLLLEIWLCLFSWVLGTQHFYTRVRCYFLSCKEQYNMNEKLDSNSSFRWPHLPSFNGTYKHPYTESNISYVDFYLHQPPVAAVFIISYLLIFLLCMVGNGVVCFIVLRSKHMRTVTNLFILNLAVSDLLVGIFCMPTTLLDNIIAGR